MATHNVNLTGHFDQFILDQVNSGRFKNASEVVRAGLGLLEQQKREEEQKLAVLRALAAEGFGELDQGRGMALNSAEELREFIGQIGCRAAQRSERPTPGG